VEGDRIIELDGSYVGRKASPVGRAFPLDSARLLAPTLPSKVVCIGRNYRDHAREMGHDVPDEPCLFIKPDTAVIGPEDSILYPSMSKRVDYEAELAIVIGRTLRNATPAEAMKGVLGCTCLNDVTARDLQQKDGQWTRGKSFDTFCPIGPCIVDDVDPDNLEIELFLNGERRQHANTNLFVFPSAELVSFISRVMTLRPGDVVATGTPAGIGPMQVGDVVEVRIEKIGTLRNRLAAGQ
jgi:2-keto-4-pentenoate hydratase/2-oxohepta-3-ene-1,7-dioic acid hydratase (catechol pathway)